MLDKLLLETLCDPGRCHAFAGILPPPSCNKFMYRQAECLSAVSKQMVFPEQPNCRLIRYEQDVKQRGRPVPHRHGEHVLPLSSNKLLKQALLTQGHL